MEAKTFRIVFVGAGNLASNLAPALREKGYAIEQIYSRTESSAHALADRVSDEELSKDYILPLAFDKRIGPAVAAAVAKAARDSGVARL